MIDMRPEEYLYWKQLMKHLDNKPERMFSGEFVWPRQWEVHLPNDHKQPCQLHCSHCAGKLFNKALGHWEADALSLMDKLKGKIPYHIYGGAYTEPLGNPYFMAFLAMTKKYNNHFGIHTNAILLKDLEDNYGVLTEMNRISDPTDYLSISIDAGTSRSWCKVKGSKNYELFNQIVKGIRNAVYIRKSQNYKGHAIRLCYLISPHSCTHEDFQEIVKIAKDIGVDSLRFSIPFANYNQSFDEVREYKERVEVTGSQQYYDALKKYLSETKEERPYIFYTGPEFTDIDTKFNFNKCAYGYYQITYGADGYVYKCSTAATPTAPQCRLGKATDDLEKFKEMIMKNYDPEFSCNEKCFSKGIRCNRMGCEISTIYESIFEGKK